MDKESPERQIFFDPSGRRWRWVRIGLVILLSASAVFLLRTIPVTLSNPDVPKLQNQAITSLQLPKEQLPDVVGSISQLTSSLRREHVPVIGEGPLIRVVNIIQSQNETYAVEPFTGMPTKQVDSSELLALGESTFAIERYGKTDGKHIALTFDDGPDPKYSAQILDALSRHSIPASFFVIGSNVVKHEDVAKRMVREGHVVANHSFTHADYSRITPARAQQETVQTQRTIRAVTGYNPAFFRFPYVGSNDQGVRDNIGAVLEVQRLGYVITSYNFDTSDWHPERKKNIPLPDLDSGEDIVMLLHDAGGDRSHTVAYIEKLSEEAGKHGYTFVNLDQLYDQPAPLFAPVNGTVADAMSYTASRTVMVWPRDLVKRLFALTVVSLLFGLVVNTVLATLHKRKYKYKRRANNYEPLVTVLVPAYNEREVISRTVRSLLRSRYRRLEVLIIDDGSTDDTLDVGRRLARASKRVRCLAKQNGGKASALNLGIEEARGEIVICVDADTIFPSFTVTRLIRHFRDPDVGAVAGSVKVGNIHNPLTQWQALEYTINIHLERSAHAYLNSIMIVPGACGAWRKNAVIAAGGYSRHTLAEDCDLTLAVHEAGYRVIQDNSAIGYTEAPQNIRLLAKQRFRWIFGNMQSFWKHRRLAFNSRYGWLGMFVLPFAMFNVMVPIIFIPMLATLAVSNIAAGLYWVILLYLALILAIQFIAGFIGVRLAGERLSLLAAVPLTRFVYSPLKTYLLYKSILTIAKGARVGWSKFKRTGTVTYVPVPEVSGGHALPK